MASHILREFSKLGISITNREITQMERLVISFETRGSHVLAFGQLLGVYPAAFKDDDRLAFFDLFGVREDEVKRMVKSIPSINNDFKVASDPFNLLAVWILHLSHAMIKNPKVRDQFMLNVAKYLHYRFFTSLVNNFFPHMANEKIMAATIDRLTRKYDIVVFGTWKKLIEARCKSLLDRSSIHYRSIEKADDDDKYLYVVTDTQTRIRDRVKNIVNVYYDTRAKGGEVKSRAAVTEIDGEKVLIHTSSALDTMVSSVFADASNVRVFVDPQIIRSISQQFPTISTSALRQTLTAISAMIKQQSLTKELDIPIVQRKDRTITVGIRVLLRDIIQSAFRYCIRNRIPLDNKAEVYIRIKNVFSSSRISDESITGVKDRMVFLIDDVTDTSRESTKSSLRLAVIMYVIFRSLRYL